MIHYTKNLKPIFTLFLLAQVPSIASAAIQLQVFDQSELFYDGPVAEAASYDIAPVSLTVQPFDSALGTLNSVDIIWDITMDAEGTNLETQSSSISHSFGGAIYIDGARIDGFGIGSGGGAAPGATFSTSASSMDNKSILSTDTEENLVAAWNTITGASAYTLSMDASDGFFGSYQFFGPLANATIAFAEGSSISVEYSYTPVPEPSAFAVVVGVAALGLVSLRRRRA